MEFSINLNDPGTSDTFSSDEILAKIALKAAKDTPVNNSNFQKIVDHKLLIADGQISRGAENYKDDNYASAICNYRMAWMYAQDAIKFAEK